MITTSISDSRAGTLIQSVLIEAALAIGAARNLVLLELAGRGINIAYTAAVYQRIQSNTLAIRGRVETITAEEIASLGG